MPSNASLRLRRQFQQELGTREEAQQRFRATIGDGAGNIEVPGKRNFVYVRREGRSRIEECHNTRVPRRNGLPVIVGYDPTNPDTLQILEPDWGGMASPDNYPYVPYHHESHEFQNADGGDDVTWIQSQQYVPLLAYPTDPLTMTVNVYGGWYCWGTNWHYFEATISADLTGSIPGIVGNARYTLISIDGATEALQYTDGAEFPIALPPADIEDMIPVAPGGSVPIVAAYLPNGITSIDWANLYDIRMMVATAGMVVPHALLSHTDSVPAAPVQGDLIVGNATPAWARFGRGTAHQLLKMNVAATDPIWAAFDWDDMAAAAGADMVHGHSAAGEGGTLDWDNVWADAVHDHSAAGEGGQLDWDNVWSDAVHTHSAAGEGGQLDWDDIWSDAVHDHSAAGEGGQNLRQIQELEFDDATLLTIDGAGAITRAQVYHKVDTFGGAASDDLVTINGGVEGDLLTIRPVNGARTVVVKHNTGNIWLQGAADLSLDDINDHLALIYDGAMWCDVGGGGGGGALADHTHSAAGDGGDQIRPDRIGVNAAVPDQDGAIAQAEIAVDPSNVAGVGMSYFKADGTQTKQYFEDDTGHVFEVAGIVRDLTVTVGVAGDFATIQDAVDWFKNWIVKGTCVIDCDPDTYAEEVTFEDILVAKGSQLVLQGDTRALAGISYIDGTWGNPAGLPNGGDGNITLSNAGAVIAVDMDSTQPDFDADGWGAGDHLLVLDNTLAMTLYEIDSVSNNEITLTVAAPDIGDDATAIALVPNRAIDGTGANFWCLLFDNVYGIKIDGWYLFSTTNDHLGMVANNDSYVYAENVLGYGTGGYFWAYSDSVFSMGSVSTTTCGAESSWGGEIKANDSGTMRVWYLAAVQSTVYAVNRSYIDASGAFSVQTNEGYYCDAASILIASTSWARQCTTGYYAALLGFIYASGTVAQCNGNVTDYDPAPSSTFGNENGSIYYD